MTDYANLQTESEKLSCFFKTNLDYISNFNLYFKSVLKEHSSFVESTSETINTICQTKYPSFSIFQSCSSIQIFYSFYRQFNKNMQIMLKDLNNKIIQQLETFHQNETHIYNDINNEFYNIKNSLLENKKELTKAEQQYKKSADSINMMVNGTISKHLLYEKECTYNDKKQIYNHKLKEMNKLLGMYNKKYTQLQDKLYLNEESRIVFLNSIFSNFILYLEEHNKRNLILINHIQSLLQANNIDDEINSIKKDFMFTNKGQRFPEEPNKQYGIYSNLSIFYSVDSNNIFSNSEIDSSLTKATNSLIISSPKIILSIYGKENQISSFIQDVFNPNEIPKNQYTEFITYITKTVSLSKEFINIFISTCRKSFYEIPNFQNLQHLSNLFNLIILNAKNNNDTFHSISFAIVYISCKIFYLNKQTQSKVYLCALISNNNSYQNHNFWIQLIEYKLTLKIEEHIQHLLNVDMIDSNVKEANTNSTNIKENENNFLLEKNGFSKRINCYSKLNEYKKELVDHFAKNEIHLILIQFIPYICNWNVSSEDAIMFITEICMKFQLSKDLMNYYVSYIDAWSFSNWNKLPSEVNNIKTINKIHDIKHKRFNQIESKFPIKQSITQMHYQQKKILIIEISKFVPLNEIVNIFLLNKLFYKQTRIKIFKKYLRGNKISLSHRLKIWECILYISSIKRKYNYEHIKNEIETSIINKNNNNSALTDQVITLIESDVKRTSFCNKKEESRTAIFFILKAIAYTKPTVNYCQGMNFICSFIYQLFQNESEAFYIMLGLIENTEFSLLFINNLFNLKKYFFMFHRLLQMILPECTTALNLSNANENIFLTPWFLTMFTNSSCIVNIDNPPLIVLTIWEMFFIKGIRALLSSSLALLKNYEHSIVELSNEEMFTYLSNNLAKIDCFNNEFYNTFIKEFNSVNVPKKILIDLEKEYQFHQKDNNKEM